MAKKPNFTRMTPGYRNMWEAASIPSDRKSVVDRVARTIIADKKRWYLDVEKNTGVPWEWVACVHDRESGGDFAGVLHNGQTIIGSGRKTTIVPKGRGPFKTWRESAYDALRLKGLDKIKSWPLERYLYEFERYNGWGYYKFKGVNSPYVWAATNHQQPGKYVKDGAAGWDANHWDRQLGCAALLLALIEADPTIQFEQEADTKLPTDPDTGADETYRQKRDRLIAELEAHTGGQVAIIYP